MWQLVGSNDQAAHAPLQRDALLTAAAGSTFGSLSGIAMTHTSRTHLMPCSKFLDMVDVSGRRVPTLPLQRGIVHDGAKHMATVILAAGFWTWWR